MRTVTRSQSATAGVATTTITMPVRARLRGILMALSGSNAGTGSGGTIYSSAGLTPDTPVTNDSQDHLVIMTARFLSGAASADFVYGNSQYVPLDFMVAATKQIFLYLNSPTNFTAVHLVTVYFDPLT